MGKKIILFVVLFAVSFPFSPVWATEEPSKTPPADAELAVDSGEARSSSGLPIPRFVALADEKVIARTGPGLKYPIKWIFQRQKMPVEVVQEFDTWRKVRDIDGDAGWVHQSLLSGARTVIVKGEAGLSVRRDAEGDSPILAYFEPGVVAAVKGCQGDWCQIESAGYDGWSQRKFLWGIYDQEDFD